MPYPAAVVLSALHTAVVGGATWFILFLALMQWENQEDPTSNDWLVPVAGILFGTALVTLVLVVAKRRILKRCAFAAHLAVALPLYVAFEIDDDSNGKLLIFVFLVELVGFAAVAIEPPPPQAKTEVEPSRL